VGDSLLARLRLGGVPVADYPDGSALDPALVPRPYLHPVRTLGGVVVTDARPPDHPWHLGLGVAVPDVDGVNLWGGPTYVRDVGYVARDDHGRIVHAGFDELDDAGFVERLHWLAPHGALLLAERRRVHARLVDSGWELEIVTDLTNVACRTLRLGSPATNGRAGAGYGGLFWRLPPVGEVRVRTADSVGEQAAHGSAAPWLAWTDGAITLVLAGTDDTSRADSWFVRVADYPGVGLQLAARDPLIVPPGGTVTRGLRALVADGVIDERAARSWADAAVVHTAR
jgi:hypothetical protein